MKQQAIIFLYQGQHPDIEAIRKISETVVDAVVCDPTTLKNVNMDEDHIAQALVAFASKEDNEPKTQCEKDPLFVVCEGMAEFIKQEIERNSISSPLQYNLKKRYILAIQHNCDEAYRCGANAMYNSHRKLQCVKYIKEMLHLDLRKAKDVVDALFEIVELCQERTNE